MPVVQVSTAPSRADYEAVNNHLDVSERPDGLILHAASETDDGQVQIVDVYESAQQLEAFARDRLFPAFEAAGVMQTVMSQPRPQAYEAFHVLP